VSLADVKGGHTMVRFVVGAGAVAAVALLAGLAGAQMGPSPNPTGGHPGTMGHMMGAAGCPGMAETNATPPALTEEQAKVAVQTYADKYLKGYAVETVLPFTGMHGRTMYSVEMKGPKEEVRTFHVNPWGNVMPFGGPWRRAG
jgi:hypothetical protein